MKKHLVRIVCWQYGHVNDLFMVARKADKLYSQVQQGKRVCPTCKTLGLGNNAFAITVSPSVMGQDCLNKAYSCDINHITVIRAFTNDLLNITFGSNFEDFVNIEGKIEEVQKLIDEREIVCHHNHGDRICGSSLSPIDKVVLKLPEASNFKTKTRVGDIWDKGGMEPVKPGSYDKDGFFQKSKTDQANRQRLKNLKKTRLVQSERLPGVPMLKPTTRTFNRRNKDTIDF